MRKTATHTQRLWRGIPSWQRSALALRRRASSRSSSSAARAPRSATRPTSSASGALRSRGRSSPCTCRSRRRARCSCSTASARRSNSERLWNPATNTFRAVPYGRNLFCSGHIQLADGRTLIVGGHINAYEGLKDTTLYNAQTNTYFRGAGHGGGALVSDRDPASRRPRAHVRRRPRSCRTARPAAAALGRVGQLAAGGLQPDDEHLDEPDQRAADLAALSAAVRPLRRPHPRRRPGHDHADPDTGDLDVVDGRDEPVRRPQRGHVPAEQDHEVRRVGRPGLPGRVGVRLARPHRRDRHERRHAGLARDRADGARAARTTTSRCSPTAPCSRAAAAHAPTGSTSSNVGVAGRDLESGHRDVDDRRLAAERPALPLDRAPAARRPRADGRRRRCRAGAHATS